VMGSTSPACAGTVTAGTVIRAVDIADLRDRIQFQRSRFGLPFFVFTDADVSMKPVKAAHVLELRTSLQDAYTAAGRASPTFTDATLTPQVTLIKAVHINELCSALAALQ